MFDANSLSPFRREKKGFIIPSFNYKDIKIDNHFDVKNNLGSIKKSQVKNNPFISSKIIEDNRSSEKSNENKNVNIELNNDLRGVSRFSLSSIKIEKEAKIKSNDEKSSIEKHKDKFTLEDLIKKWKDYIRIKQDNGHTIIASLLEMTSLNLKGDNLVLIETNSESNKIEIIKEMPALLSYLKKSLNNYVINFEINIVSTNESKLIFTNKEKLEYLKDLNPNIKLLINEFEIKL